MSANYYHFSRFGTYFSRLSLLSLCLLCLTIVTACPSRAAEPDVFEIGVLPYVGLSELIKAYGPLSTHLEKELKRPVRIVTARGYDDFLLKTQRRSYPLVITASHFARLAEREAGYVPVLRPETNYHVMLLVAANSSTQAVKDLKSARVATPGVLAQTTMMGRVMLTSHGLNPNRDVTIIDSGNQKNALLAVLHGDADAGIVSEGAYRHMREEDRRGLREIKVEGQWATSIPVLYAVSPLVKTDDRERLVAIITHFANVHPEGRKWIDGLKYGGLRVPTVAEMKSLDNDVAELRQVFNVNQAP